MGLKNGPRKQLFGRLVSRLECGAQKLNLLRDHARGRHRLLRRGKQAAVEMDDPTRKAVLVAYQKRKQEEIAHPFLKERVAFGIVPHTPAMLLARRARAGRGALGRRAVGHGS